MANMKQVFADTVIEMLKTRPLSSITVKDVVMECGVSRQSFYYHFNDIYDVIEWFFTKETEKALQAYSDIDSWQTGYIRIMYWAQKNRPLVMNTYASIQREYIEVFMYRVLYQYIIKVVQNEATDLNVNEQQCAFVAQFYTLAINAVSLEWIKTGMKDKPESIAESVNFMIEGDFRKALLKFESSNGNQYTFSE